MWLSNLLITIIILTTVIFCQEDLGADHADPVRFDDVLLVPGAVLVPWRKSSALAQFQCPGAIPVPWRFSSALAQFQCPGASLVPWRFPVPWRKPSALTHFKCSGAIPVH